MKHIAHISDQDITGSLDLSLKEPRIAVNGILFDDQDQIALIYSGKHKFYTIPGGGVEAGETLEIAVKRELLEETGCNASIIYSLGLISENRFEHDFTQERSYYIAKVCGSKGPLQLTAEEIEDEATVVWLPFEDAFDAITKPEHDSYRLRFIQARDRLAIEEAKIWKELHEVEGFDSFKTIELVDKGWSGETKYKIEAKNGDKYLIRLAPIEQAERKIEEFNYLKRLEGINIPMQEVYNVERCNLGKSVYTLFSWIDGVDLEEILPLLTDTEQYVLGYNAGEILKKIHRFPALDSSESWSKKFSNKINNRIKAYEQLKDQGLTDGHEEYFLRYIKANKHLLEDRPQCFHHGDYHVGNMLLTKDLELYIIDWNRYDFGDPWEEWIRIVFSAAISPFFATGQVHGYFDGEPPEEFFQLLAFYIASNQIGALSWAYAFGESEVEFSKEQNRFVLDSYHDMQKIVPSWYQGEVYIQSIDGIPFRLKEHFDFSFLSKWGKVFKVFDDQDSGNICFGVENENEQYFIKFAGSPTVRSTVSSEDAIEALKLSTKVYKDLKHKSLIELIETKEIAGGYMAVFKWVNSYSFGRMYPLSRIRFLDLPLETKSQIFIDVLSFHTHVISKGYVAVDFYDASILYDIDREQAVICDVDFYSKAPLVNTMGRMWGSKNFMSPEEFKIGATIDERSNVYAMGATAFALFGDLKNRSIDTWTLSKAKFDLATKAMNHARDLRFDSIKTFMNEWQVAD